MATTNSDFLPNVTGLNLGSPDQMWDIYADNITVGGVIVADGNATELQGTPICITPPAAGNILLSDGVQWCPSAIVNATELQGRPIDTTAPGLSDVLTWSGLAWAPATGGGGGGGATFGYVTVPFAATPTFTSSPLGSCTFAMTLTGNVTSSTFSSAGLSAGSLFNFILAQDGSGGHTFAWPAVALGMQPIATAASLTTVQSLIWNGTNLIPNAFPTVF